MDYPRSKMIEKLRNDELVISTKLNITDNIGVEIAAMAGYDCIWIDMEHVANDYSQIGKCILAAKAYGAEIIVRTTRGAYSNLTRPLELDANGIMVPHVMNYEDAAQVGYYTKFHPRGRRPIDGGNADGRYCLLSVEDYIQYSNEEKLTIIQIEDVEAMEDLERIAQVPGIDMLFFGPADFSHSLGLPADTANERTLEARRKVAEVARKYGKMAGTVGGLGNLKELYDMGYRLINLGADVIGLSNYFSDLVKGAKAMGLK